MEATYNFILTELLWYSEDNEFINGFVDELKNKKISLEIEYLNKKSFTTKLYADLKILLDKTLDETQQKLDCVKVQDFEGAAYHRNSERTSLNVIEGQGFNLYMLDNAKFVLYHVDVEKLGPSIKFTIYTNSKECRGLIKGIRGKMNIA
jgi:hypothetical protein